MKAEITLEQIWFNVSLKNFFFRDQAYETLEELVRRSKDGDRETIEYLTEYTEDMDIDDVEEIFYSESVEYCANEFGIELEEEDEDDD